MNFLKKYGIQVDFIKGFEDYLITSDGKVFSLKSMKFLSTDLRGGKYEDYEYVTIYDKEGNKHNKYVHKLVADAFIQNPNNLQCVNHKDENKQNNNVSNLEFCTQRYNIIYSVERKKRRGMQESDRLF